MKSSRLRPLQLPSRNPTNSKGHAYLALSMNEKGSEEQDDSSRSFQCKEIQSRGSTSSLSSGETFLPKNHLRLLILPLTLQMKPLFTKRPKLMLCLILSLFTLAFIIIYQVYETNPSFHYWWRTSSDSTTSTLELDRPNDAYDKPASRKQLPRRPIWIESHREMLAAGQLVNWIANGKIEKGLDLSAHSRIDALFTWVNGSDPRHILAREFYAKDPTRIVFPPDHLPSASAKLSRPKITSYSPQQGTLPFLGDILSSPPPNNAKLQNIDSRFRDNGELLYALRSAKMYLGEYLGTMHILSTDFWEHGKPQGEPRSTSTRRSEGRERGVEFSRAALTEQRSDRFVIEGGLERLGQIPQWLDVDQEGVLTGQAVIDYSSDESQEPPTLMLHHDWNTFRPLTSIDPASQALPESTQGEAELLAWKLAHLPTFNSMAAESFLGVGIPGLSEIFTASSDDMALGRPVSTADFASPLYGPVLHINHQLSIYPQEKPSPGLGEAPSHHYSAFLLSERFGFRSSHYIVHIQKSHLTPLMLETRLIWGNEFSQTSGKRFRGDGTAMNSHMLSYGLNIERHREALLWSFFMLKVDSDGDNRISDSELREAKGMMGWDGIDTNEKIQVAFPKRLSSSISEIEASFLKANLPKPLASIYEFTSMDGYAYAFNMQRGSRQWPLFYEEKDDGNKDRFEKPACFLDLRRCINGERRADSLFKHFAFEKVQCGDCLINHLVGQSGESGLSAFLPQASETFPKVETTINGEEVPPHLPLDKKWRSADFRVETVLKNTGFSEGNEREFAALLISRYNYAIASAPASFVMMNDPDGLERALKRIDTEEVAFMCFNDDITSRREETISKLHDWYEKKFDQTLSFEL